MKRRLGNLERQLFAFAQMRGLRELRSGDLTGPLAITAKQERELLTRLSRSGLIAKVRRGSTWFHLAFRRLGSERLMTTKLRRGTRRRTRHRSRSASGPLHVTLGFANRDFGAAKFHPFPVSDFDEFRGDDPERRASFQFNA